jgi:hypothetical protein
MAHPLVLLTALTAALSRGPGLPPGSFAELSEPAAVEIFAAPAAAPVVAPGLWASLAAPDPAVLAWLAGRVPGLDVNAVKTMTPEAAEAMLADCEARGLSPLDFFTDAGFRGPGIFYFPKDLLAAIYARYDFRVITPVSGKDERGVPFSMQALVAGAGRIESLYDRDDITFLHRDFQDGKYTVKVRVTERILGQGDMSVSGVTAHIGILSADIRRFTKISPTEGRVETSLGSRTKPTVLITRRK